MPPPVPTLYGADTISEFLSAAQQRFDEADVLRAAGFHGGAIYLYGYVAEMILKAACYRVWGLGPNDPVEDNRSIMEDWIAEHVLNKTRRVRPHELGPWARWLVVTRASFQGPPYNQQFSLDLGANTNAVEQIWLPSMRYHPLPWGAPESTDVRTAAQWFLSQYPNT
jgi:hypothetical protein